MKALMRWIIALLVVVAVPVHAEATDGVTGAQTASLAWLNLTDNQHYAQSWEEAAAIFRDSISKADWDAAVQSVRTPLGAVISRKLKSAVPAKGLPGAPDSEYVVIRFDTQFEKMPVAVETVTPMRDQDGKWKVAGYFIE